MFVGSDMFGPPMGFAGKLDKRMTTFDDFIDVAHHLNSENMLSKEIL